MSDKRQGIRGATAWHPPFYALLTESAPPTTEVRTEVPLSMQPRRADVLLLRRKDTAPRDHEAHVLRGLWPLLGPVTLAEFKGPSSGYRHTDLLRLQGYGVQYHEMNAHELGSPSELTLALFTPALTPSLREAVARMGWELVPLGNGYARIAGAWYTTIVAFIDEVCEAERDDYLRLFSRHSRQSREALRWLNARFLRMTTMDDLHELEGYDELVERLLSTLPPQDVLRHYKAEDVLHHYKPEEVLHHYKPEEVLRHYGLDTLLRHLRDLSPAERAAAEKKLPPDMLQALRKYVDEMS